MLKILLIEDNPGDVLLVQRALEEHHIPNQLKVIADGEQALRFVNDMGKHGEPPCPDVLVLDLNLPKADGLQVLRRFRSNDDCQTTPVIVVSSSDAPNDRESCAALGIDHYFRKPVDLNSYLLLGAIIKSVAGKLS